MPRYPSLGPITEERVRKVVRKLVVESTANNTGCNKIEIGWDNNDSNGYKLTVKTNNKKKLQELLTLSDQQYRDCILLLKDMKILEDKREQTQGCSTHHYTLIFPSKNVDEILKSFFPLQWEELKREQKSKHQNGQFQESQNNINNDVTNTQSTCKDRGASGIANKGTEGQNPSGKDLSNEEQSRRTNLSGADLRGTDLTAVNLSDRDLRKANLSRQDLSGRDLSKADLSGANLRGTNLRSANLSGADLRNANLSKADLTGVDLTGVDLRGTDLSDANLSDANLSKANTLCSAGKLSNVNLSNAIGLPENMRDFLKRQGAIFENSPRSTELQRSQEVWSVVVGGVIMVVIVIMIFMMILYIPKLGNTDVVNRLEIFVMELKKSLERPSVPGRLKPQRKVPVPTRRIP